MTDRYLLTDKPERVRDIYLDIALALLPLLVWAMFLYGIRPLTLTVISVLTVTVIDVAVALIRRKRLVLSVSSVVTGMITALLLPASAPLWLPALAGAVSGGIKNALGGAKLPVNPSAISILICHFAFPKLMNAIPKSRIALDGFAMTLKDTALAPQSSLDTVLNGPIPESNLWGEFFGFRAGLMGEMSSFLLIAGLIYLCYRRIIKPLPSIIFVVCIGLATYFRPTLVAATDFVAIRGALFNVFGSSTLLCAIYLPFDLPTASVTRKSAILGGVAGGIVTVAVRYLYSTPISALCGAIVMGVIIYLLDRFDTPSPFGGTVKKS